MLVKSCLFTASFVLAISLATTAQASVTCAGKQHDIEEQIRYAQLHGNANQIAGLQKALQESREHCTDQALQAELQKHVSEKERKVGERQRELADAQASGKPGKIAKKQQRLEEAQQSCARCAVGNRRLG
ncbi:DUF1090 domain-containing protein [Dyella sp. 2RAB6]|uniref:DUF1090 domain-containing protein n=1 Tax=Dyella sp. 2RAB6 TaxID=3232992 RepID=UPI003F913DA0